MATVTILVSAPLTGTSEANGLNDIGEVVGQLDGDVPYVWRPFSPNATSGTETRLPVLPTGAAPGSGIAFAINTTSVIVGSSLGLDASGNVMTRAVRWVGGGVQPLGTLIPDPVNPGFFLGSSRALDINDLGQIVGASDTVVGVEHAFLFDPTLGFMRDLGALSVPTPLRSRATSINNNGDIVGVSETFDANGNVVEHAFLLIAGNPIPIDLGTTTPDPANPGFFLGSSGAFGINDHFQFVGTSDVSGVGPGGLQLTGAVQFVNGSLPIPLLPVHSTGYDIGPGNHVVGNFDFPERGFVLHSTTGLVDLTALAATPGMRITLGTGVNAVGQVTAMADVGGSSVGVLITP